MALRAAPGFRGCIAAILLLLPGPVSAGGLEPASGPVAALTLDRLDGPAFSLAETAGRPVLIHFFATWCLPCLTEFAGLDRLAGRRAGQALAIVAVDVAEPEARVRRFREAAAPGLTILLDRDRAAARAWSVSSLPATILLYPGHAVAWRADGPVDWDSAAANATLDRVIGIRPSPGEGSDEPT